MKNPFKAVREKLDRWNSKRRVKAAREKLQYKANMKPAQRRPAPRTNDRNSKYRHGPRRRFRHQSGPPVDAVIFTGADGIKRYEVEPRRYLHRQKKHHSRPAIRRAELARRKSI